MNAIETAESHIADMLQSLRELGVIVRREPEITAYLVKHEEILDALPPIVEKLGRNFPEHSLLLEYWVSHEDYEDAFPRLVVCETSSRRIPLEAMLTFYEQSDKLLSFTDGWLGVVSDFYRPESNV